MKSISERIVLLKDQYPIPDEAYQEMVFRIATDEKELDQKDMITQLIIPVALIAVAVGMIIGMIITREQLIFMVSQKAPEVLPLLFK